MAKWVKLPDDAQVTMSRESWEATGGLGLGGKAVVAFLIFLAVWLFGHGVNSNQTDHPTPKPSPSVSVQVDRR